MRKKIGVFVGELPEEYQRCIVKAAFAKAGCLGYDVFVFAVYGGYGDNVLYAEGEKAILQIPDLSTLDGIIVAEDTFYIDGIEEELAHKLETEAKCPVVYLRRVKKQFYSVLVTSREPMADMVRHFVYHHGFRDICFMQGNMSFQDARDRYQGFLDVMEEAGIPVTEHMVFEGDYWREKGKQAVDWFMEGRDTYPQAIICANDYMAISVCDELKHRGVRIPEDVCVSGYDNTLESMRYFPSISSVCVHFDKLAMKAVEMIDRVNRGLPQAAVEYVDPEMVFLRSCGCGKQVFVDDWEDAIQKLYKKDTDIRRIVFMTTECQEAYDEEEYLRVLAKYFKDTRAAKGFLCMCEPPEENIEEQDEGFSEQMVLKRIYTGPWDVTVCNERFPRTELLPRHILEEAEPGGYLVLGIHYKNKCYGYMVLVYEGDVWIDCYAQVYMSCIANVIQDAEIHRQIAGLEEIRKLYQIDPLTGIYNRRGFEKRLRAMYEELYKTQDYLSVVSIDMDGLKYINDNYGHQEGDAALCMLADALKELVTGEEICARVGGDEFAAILLSKDSHRHEQFIKDFEAEIIKVADREKKPYPFHASIGACCINDEQGLSLMGCIKKADKTMYEQKRRNKASAGKK
ncbi:MAG: GGDEF domain-containing protein [Acetatifactor sp.]